MELGNTSQPNPSSMAQLPSSVYIADERAQTTETGRQKGPQPARFTTHEPSMSQTMHRTVSQLPQLASYNLTLASPDEATIAYDAAINSSRNRANIYATGGATRPADNDALDQVNSSPDLAKGNCTDLGPLHATVARPQDVGRARQSITIRDRHRSFLSSNDYFLRLTCFGNRVHSCSIIGIYRIK
jgi:hypothetical protein